MPIHRRLDILPQTPQKLTEQNRQDHAAVCPPGDSFKMQRPLGVTAISSEADRKAQQNQQGIQQLRNKRGNRSTLYPHGGKPELAEYQQVVQPGVGSHRAKAGPKGNGSVFLAAQPRGQDCAERHRQISECYRFKIHGTGLLNTPIGGVKLQNLCRKAPGGQQKQHRQQSPAKQADIQAAPCLPLVVRACELGNQDPGNGADRADHHGKNQRKIAIQSHSRNIDLAQLPNHDLIYYGKGCLQHTLQGNGNGNFAQRFHKVRHGIFLVLSLGMSVTGRTICASHSLPLRIASRQASAVFARCAAS